MPIQSNRFYVIPPNKDMEIIDSVLVLMRRKPKPGAHLSIDQFFIFLANHQKGGTIGIVFPGWPVTVAWG